MPEIQIKNVAKRFGAYQALSDINLTVEDQEFRVLLGASGCGKSTLLGIIAGYGPPPRARSDRGPPFRTSRVQDRGISMVFENYAVFPHLPVFENIGFGLRMQKLP